MARGGRMPRQTRSEVIAVRACCLYAQMLRGLAEGMKKDPTLRKTLRTELEAKELSELAKQSLGSARLRKAFTPREKTMIEAKLGRLGWTKAREATYRAEPLSVLLWALNVPKSTSNWARLSDNAYRCLSPEMVAKSGWDTLLRGGVVRPVQELRRLRRIADLYAWRVRVEGVALTDGVGDAWSDKKPAAVTAEVKKRAARAKRKKLADVKNGDIAFANREFGKFYGGLLDVMGLESAFIERLRACNWLLKPATPWRKVDVKTPIGVRLCKGDIGDARFFSYYFCPTDDRWSEAF
jgi:hypothetical protein